MNVVGLSVCEMVLLMFCENDFFKIPDSEKLADYYFLVKYRIMTVLPNILVDTEFLLFVPIVDSLPLSYRLT